MEKWMEEKNETLKELAENLDTHFTNSDGGEIDLDYCANIAKKLGERIADAETRLKLGEKLYEDLCSFVLTRARAVEMLTGDKGLASFASDSLNRAGYDFEALTRIRDHVNREFNQAFSQSGKNGACASGQKFDSADFKC
jgi:hypothetical protein